MAVVAEERNLAVVSAEVLAQSVLFGPAQPANSHQLAQGINNELVH
jgi:hypothetical protein